MVHGLQLAPLYDTLGEQTVAYVLNQTETSTLCLTEDHVDLLCRLKTGQVKNDKGEIQTLHHLKNLILMGE